MQGFNKLLMPTGYSRLRFAPDAFSVKLGNIQDIMIVSTRNSGAVVKIAAR